MNGLSGDPWGTRTPVTAVKGRCLNHLTKGPQDEFGRGEGIRTPDPMLPKHVRYQTALHPVQLIAWRVCLTRRSLLYNTVP